MSQACHAIGEAHRLGIVHRDLKPSNLFLSRRSDGSPLVKVLDFGISKASSAEIDSPFSGNLTNTSAVMGSPLYMSPEQVRDAKQVDTRADIWSLGVILHELLTGRPAFQASTLPGVCAAIICDDPPALRSLREDAPEELELIVARCLSKSVDTRYQSTRELVEALKPFAPEKPRQRSTVEDTIRPPGSEAAPLSEQEATSSEATMQSNQLAASARAARAATPMSLPKPPPWSVAKTSESAGATSIAMANSSITQPGAQTAPSPSKPSGNAATQRFPLPLAIGATILGIALAGTIFVVGRSQSNAPVAPSAAALAAPPVAPGKKSFLLLIESMPSGADVVEGDKVLGTTPLQLSVDNDAARVDARKIAVKRAGFQSYSIVQGSSDDNVRVVAALVAIPPDAAAPPATSADANNKTSTSKPASTAKTFTIPVGQVVPAPPATTAAVSPPPPTATTPPGDIRLNR